jgi:hypothetical protein
MLKSDGRLPWCCPTTCYLKAGRAKHSKETAGNHQPAHHPSVANGDILQAGGKGKRTVLRQQAGLKKRTDQRDLVLRLQNQHHFHAEEESDEDLKISDFIGCYRPQTSASRAETYTPRPILKGAGEVYL